MNVPQHFQQLCRQVAQITYNQRPPSDAYAERTARLLYMTGAHESGGFRWRRQMGFNSTSTQGAFGIWQCEWGSIADSCAWLDKHPCVRFRLAAWLYQYHEMRGIPLYASAKEKLLTILQTSLGDPLSCAFARLHYFRDPSPIPETIGDLAAYAKRVYNTSMGAAKAADYERAYRQHWPGG